MAIIKLRELRDHSVLESGLLNDFTLIGKNINKVREVLDLPSRYLFTNNIRDSFESANLVSKTLAECFKTSSLIQAEMLVQTNFTSRTISQIIDQSKLSGLFIKSHGINRVNTLQFSQPKNSTVKPQREKRKIVAIPYENINIDVKDINIYESRLVELNNAYFTESYTTVCFQSGSILEGILQHIVRKYPYLFQDCDYTKEKKAKGRPWEWNLEVLIECAYHAEIITYDVRRQCHFIRDNRNLIHLEKQKDLNFIPTVYTANIIIETLNEVLSQIVKKTKTFVCMV